MLISLKLNLVSAKAGELPPHLGRAVYAVVLRRLGETDAPLARAVHDADGPKPLTCSGLLGLGGDRDPVPIAAGRPVSLRVTGLTPAVSAALRAALLDQPPAELELDRHPFAVTGALCDPAADPWTGSAAYEALAAGPLGAGGAPTRRVTFEFASPTAFKSAGLGVALPLPGLVFGSLVERWNAFSPVTVSGEMRRFGEEMVALSRFRLESRAVTQKNEGLRIGAVGRATYVATGGDRYWLALLGMLADFALYSGVGVQTATGMGQARRVG